MCDDRDARVPLPSFVPSNIYYDKHVRPFRLFSDAHGRVCDRFHLCTLWVAAELEWLARDGDRFHFALDGARRHEEVRGDSRLLRSRFGIVDIFEQQWVEDDFHPTYEGAPTTSAPWIPVRPARA